MLETVKLESVREEYLLGCQIEGKASFLLTTQYFYISGESRTIIA